MKSAIFLLAVASLHIVVTDAAECKNGWEIYKDEKCIKVFPDILTYDEARLFCASKGNSVSSSTLVMVKDSEMQEFLVNYTKDIYDYIWLGVKYDNNSAQFRWEDGDSLSYTNWNEGYPRNITSPDVCIQLKPRDAKVTNSDGKWEDAPCQKRNLAICQRTAPWSLEDATREIINLRKELAATKQDLEAKVVPVGSIYVEYFYQPSPPSLWPTLKWEDVTELYGGLFFRALGGNSENWGNIQPECAPRISEFSYKDRRNADSYPRHLAIPANGWSEFGCTGFADNNEGHGVPYTRWHEAIRFFTVGCEVRPKNQAIKIWKRLA